MKWVYHAGYRANLPAGHPYPMGKYPILREKLLEQHVVPTADWLEPAPLPRALMELAHTPTYLDKLESATLSPSELRRLGVPWSDALWLRSRLAAAGTLLAARAALDIGLAANLAGGTHHAFTDHGEGFCVLNDVAIAIATLRQQGLIKRAAVIDLDVHQGNGTAAIFEDVDDVFTFSMHGEHNYPKIKMRSTLDVPLADGTVDAAYNDILARHLPVVLERSRPQIVFYLAGVDVAAGDRYGRLSLSEAGIRERERLVVQAIRGRGIPLVITLAGGYAATPAATAALHMNVFREAVAYQRQGVR